MAVLSSADLEIAVEDGQNIVDAITQFLTECRSSQLSMGGDATLPRESELAILGPVELNPNGLPAAMSTLRSSIDLEDSYHLLSFATRMAVYGARTGSARPLKLGIFGLFTDQLVDWRDRLVAFAIVEDCARRLDMNFAALVRPKYSDLATDKVARLLINDYLRRADDWRNVETMGFVVVGEGENLCFKPRHFMHNAPEWKPS